MTDEKTQHTPAPWESRPFVPLGSKKIKYWFIYHGQGGERRILTKVDCNEADARLIAAAPELLAALIELSDYVFDEYIASHPLCERAAEARAVIAKATEGAARSHQKGERNHVY